MWGSGVSPLSLVVVWVLGLQGNALEEMRELVLDESGSLAEIPFIFLPVFCWVSLVFSVFLAGLVMPVWMVVVSTHPM